MELDLKTSLAFNIHSNKGVYALLLGSGVSRAAEIPTGWEMMEDLIKKVAISNDKDCGENPFAWFKEEYKKEANYSDLIKEIAPTPAERNSLLKKYFEPTLEEIEEGKKIPTEAHKAIAALVSKGYIKVIITTNFDRLLEGALEEVGVIPKVISNPDTAKGSLPLTHSSCTIIKLHGDYLDLRIKNTCEELSTYDKTMNDLLDRVLDDYGIVMCGWSVKWDLALRDAIQRRQSRRFTTFFTYRNKLEEEATQLIENIDAKKIKINSADDFFNELNEKINSLETYDQPHPLSSKLAVESLKRYLPDVKYEIKLHDLLLNEAEKVNQQLNQESFPIHEPSATEEEFKQRVNKYESVIEILQALLTYGFYWANDTQISYFQKAIEVIGKKRERGGGVVVWSYLQYYPLLLLIYTCGISALAGGKYANLEKLLIKTQINYFHESFSIIKLRDQVQIMDGDAGKFVNATLLDKTQDFYVPVSEYLFQTLRDDMKDLLPDEELFEYYFNRFEYYFALIQCDIRINSENPSDRYWGPLGRYSYKSKILEDIDKEIEQEGDSWCLLKAGFFGGSLDRLKKSKEGFDTFIKGLNRY